MAHEQQVTKERAGRDADALAAQEKRAAAAEATIKKEAAEKLKAEQALAAERKKQVRRMVDGVLMRDVIYRAMLSS